MNVSRIAHTLGVLSIAMPLTVLAAQTGATDGQWRYYGGGPGGTRYSPLNQINAANAGELTIAWRWKSANFGPTPEIKTSVTPLMINGVLYATAGFRRAVVAIDAGTGETLWTYRMDEGERGRVAPRRNSGRGVAYWSDRSGDERILLVTPGYHLVSLNAKTGLPTAGFGQNGIVDLKQDLDQPVDPIEGIIGSSSPPLIVGDVAIIGAALEVGLRPPSMRNVPGHVRGYDVRTGERRWIFHTVPRPGELGHDTWADSSWAYSGNAAVWPPFVADADLGYVYLPVEAATSDYYGGHRLGDNLFSTSLVALNAATGERVWHYQIVHHDVFDYDNPTSPILANVTVNGQPRRIVVQLTKQAFAYVFDRVTGEPIWPIEERPVPPSDVPGERTSPTQPFPTKPAAYDRQGFTVDDLVDFTPELRAEALGVVEPYRMGPLFTPASLVNAPDGTRGTLSMPGTTGGTNWEGGALDAEEGILFVGSKTDPSVLALDPNPEGSDLNYHFNMGFLRGPQRLPLVKPPWGRITAIDLNTGEHLWMMANGDTPEAIRNHRALQGVDLPRTGKPTRAGLLVTKTLLFAGEGFGGDAVFRAHDKFTGEIVMEFALPAAQSGLPMTYMHEGVQYIVMAIGDRNTPGELVALKLRR